MQYRPQLAPVLRRLSAAISPDRTHDFIALAMSLSRSAKLWDSVRSSPSAEREAARDRIELSLIGIGALFVLLNALAYSVVSSGRLTWDHLWAPVAWLTGTVVFHLVLKNFKPSRDPYILPIVAFLSGWGLLLIDRLAPNFLGRQVLWVLLAYGVAATIAVWPGSLMPLIRYRYTLLVAGLALLALTLVFGVNPSGGGARLWLPLPIPLFTLPIYFQPSELMKIIMVVFFASYFTEREPQLRYGTVTNGRGNGGLPSAIFANVPFLGPLLVMWGFCMLLLVWQQDLGAASLFFILFLSLLYIATGQRSYLIGGLFLFAVAVVFAYIAFGDVVAPRVNTWLNPWPQASDQAYQVVQSLYAFGAGRLIGQGIGQGFPDYIPVVHSDFAFAAIGEEWGLLGAFAIVICFAVLAERGIRTALAAISSFPPRHFYSYLATGITVMLAAQSLLIMSGVTKLLPLTGVTLPFVSYGGSSLLISFVLVGLLLYLSARTNPET